MSLKTSRFLFFFGQFVWAIIWRQRIRVCRLHIVAPSSFNTWKHEFYSVQTSFNCHHLIHKQSSPWWNSWDYIICIRYPQCCCPKGSNFVKMTLWWQKWANVMKTWTFLTIFGRFSTSLLLFGEFQAFGTPHTHLKALAPSLLLPSTVWFPAPTFLCFLLPLNTSALQHLWSGIQRSPSAKLPMKAALRTPIITHVLILAPAAVRKPSLWGLWMEHVIRAAR